MRALTCVYLTCSSMLDGYVGCNFLFHLAALKNDTASYVLQVFPTGVPSFPVRRAFLPLTIHSYLSVPAHVLWNPPAHLSCVLCSPMPTKPAPSLPFFLYLSRTRSCSCVHTLALCTHTRCFSSADTFYYSFNGTRNTRPGLPEGSIWYNIEATDATQVFTFSWTPEEGQEGRWQVCFATQVCVRVCICVCVCA